MTQAIKDECRPSEYLGLDHCNRCGACCRISPCQFKDREDVERVAEHVGLPIEYFVSTYLAMTRKDDLMLVTPKPADNGACCFLDGNDCSLHGHQPIGGQLFECWSNARTLKPFTWRMP